MTGIEKILKAIEEDAQAEYNSVLAQAENTASEILTAAKQEAEQKCVQIAEKSAAEVAATIRRAESAAALQEKKILLEAKQQILSNIITKARDTLANLSDSEYIDIILHMVKKNAHNSTGKILFSASDQKRLPVDFNDKLKAALSDKPSAALTVSDKSAAIDGGFILVYGDIEENCSFDAMFSASKELLLDKVHSLLFE